MPAITPIYIQVNRADNVAIIANDGGLASGTVLGCGVTLREDIPQAHKAALAPIARGEAIIRYGVPVGYAKEDIPAGAWVSEARSFSPDPPDLETLRRALPSLPRPAPLPPLEERYEFQGYRNPDGSVGTRNMLCISTTVQCAAAVTQAAASRIRAELLPRYPNVDDVVVLDHAYGCGVAIDVPDADIPIRTLRNIARNPNFGCQPLLVSLGCEKLTPERLFPEGCLFPTPLTRAEELVVSLQDETLVGFDAMIGAIMDAAEKRLALLDMRRREPCPASSLVLGLQCGGSDAFSGAAANPALGVAADMVARAGGTVFFSEVTEVRDGIERLAHRAADRETAEALIREMAWYDAYLARGGADRSANTTPGNKKGGLNNITEKAMGSIAKSGSSPICGVYGPGERIPPDKKGLYFVATPASDLVCSPAQVAAGMNVLVFVTGRGTPYGLAEVPTLKVGTRNDLARRWHDLVDYNAGRIVTGEISVEEAGKELFRLVLEVAGGRKPCAEKLRLFNALSIFNPAPIT